MKLAHLINYVPVYIKELFMKQIQIGLKLIVKALYINNKLSVSFFHSYHAWYFCPKIIHIILYEHVPLNLK